MHSEVVGSDSTLNLSVLEPPPPPHPLESLRLRLSENAKCEREWIFVFQCGLVRDSRLVQDVGPAYSLGTAAICSSTPVTLKSGDKKKEKKKHRRMEFQPHVSNRYKDFILSGSKQI